MKHKIAHLTLAAALGVLLAAGSGCLDEKVIDIVLSNETCADFVESHDTETWITAMILNYGDEIDDVLDENGYSRDDIKSASLVTAWYRVTSFSHSHDWDISGSISVARTDLGGLPVTLLTYTDQSVQAALDVNTYPSLAQAGVDVLNTALQDFIDGENPILTFAVSNGDVTPSPSVLDRLQFEWRGCIRIQVVVDEELEVPDPF